jgi:hypothetical protein
MSIKWDRVTALILALFAFWLLVNNGQAVSAFLSSMKDIGPGHSADEQTIGLIAFGLVGVCIVAIVKILTQNRRK